VRGDPQYQLASVRTVEEATEDERRIFQAIHGGFFGFELSLPNPAVERMHHLLGVLVVEHQKASH
jgi:hypothetical protein